VFQTLQNTHQLLERQIEIVEITKKNSSQQKLVIDQQQKALEDVRGELWDVQNKLSAQGGQHREAVEEWRQKVSPTTVMLLAQGRYKNTGDIDVNDNFNQTSGHSAHAEHKQTDKVHPMKTIEIITA
jgi:hypothetical protein